MGSFKRSGSAFSVLCAIFSVLLCSTQSSVSTNESNLKSYNDASNITLALLQLPTTISSSISTIETYISAASSNGADIAIFPSSFLQGSCREKWLNETSTWSQKYKMAICITCNNNNVSSNTSLSTNTSEAMLIDQNGNMVLFYSKPQLDNNTVRIRNSQDWPIGQIWIKNKFNVTIGVILDDDIRFAEISRVLMLNGVELILYPTKHNMSLNDDILLYTRAFENVLIIARTNRAASGDINNIDNDNDADNGRSAVGSTYGLSENYSEMFWTPPANNQSQIVYSNINLQYIYNARQTSIFGDAYRRPFRYQLLCNLSSDDGAERNYNNYDYKHGDPSDSDQHLKFQMLKTRDDNDILVKIAALQMIPGKTVNENLEIATKFIIEAKENGADIVFMPEMFSIGYETNFPNYIQGNMTNLQNIYQNWLSMAVSVNSSFINHFQNLSKSLSIGIGVSYMRSMDVDFIPPFNCITMFDKQGNLLYTYSKVHTVDVAPAEALTTPGHDWYSAQLHLGMCTLCQRFAFAIAIDI